MNWVRPDLDNGLLPIKGLLFVAYLEGDILWSSKCLCLMELIEIAAHNSDAKLSENQRKLKAYNT